MGHYLKNSSYKLFVKCLSLRENQLMLITISNKFHYYTLRACLISRSILYYFTVLDKKILIQCLTPKFKKTELYKN